MAQKVLCVCEPNVHGCYIIFDQNADPCPRPLKFWGLKFFIIFSLLASQNLKQWFSKRKHF